MGVFGSNQVIGFVRRPCTLDLQMRMSGKHWLTVRWSSFRGQGRPESHACRYFPRSTLRGASGLFFPLRWSEPSSVLSSVGVISVPASLPRHGDCAPTSPAERGRGLVASDGPVPNCVASRPKLRCVARTQPEIARCGGGPR